MITCFFPLHSDLFCPPLPVATTLPTPHQQLTTDIKGTLSLTAQQPITEDPLTTTTSQDDGNGETQTGLLVTTTGPGSGEPTTSEAVAESQSSSGFIAIVGGIVGVGLVILTLSVVTIISITAVLVRKKKCHSTSFNVTYTEEKAYYA